MTNDLFRAELLRLREIVCEEDAESIDRVLASEPSASSAAGVVTKRIDRVGGTSEVSFYAIGPKRARHAEAAEDRERFSGVPWTYCSDALPDEAGRYEVAVWNVGVYATDPARTLNRFAFWTDDRYWITEISALHAVYAWRPITDDPPPLRPEDHAYLIEQGVPPEWLKGEDR